MSNIATTVVQGKDALPSRPIPCARHSHSQPLTSEELRPSSLSIPSNICKIWWWGHGVVLTAVERHRYLADTAAWVFLYEPKEVFPFSDTIPSEVPFSYSQGSKYQQSLNQWQRWNIYVKSFAAFWCLQITNQVITLGQSAARYSRRAFIRDNSNTLYSKWYIF